MSPSEFTFWLQGFFEIADPKSLDERQIQVIKDHIALVLNKVTPDRNKEEPKTTLEGNLTLEQWQKILKGKPSPDYTPPVQPFPQFPGVMPDINPLGPPYTVTCSTNETKGCVNAASKDPNDTVFIC